MTISNASLTGTHESYAPAVVIPADRPASVAVARLLGRRGIKVYGIDANPKANALTSKYMIPKPLPNGDESDEAKLDHLIRIGEEIGQAVLYPVRDNEVLFCSMHRNELSKNYRFVMPDNETIHDVLTKDGLSRIAEKHNVPRPQSYPVSCQSDVMNLVGRINYPVILKPAFSPSWLREEIARVVKENYLSGAPKVVYCDGPDRMIDIYQKIAPYDPGMIVQEVIPGEDHFLVYYCFYLDRQSTPLATFAGIKERVLPVGFGSATYVKSFYDKELEEISLNFLSAIHYKGLGGVEFKKDPRDGQYKLIEFNARLGMWDSYGARCGVDIPFTAYCDALNQKVVPQRQYRNGVFWIDLLRDTRAFLILRRQKRISVWQWLRSLFVEKEWAYFTWDDWRPAWISIKEVVVRFLHR